MQKFRGDYCRMQKSIKLLLLSASFSWSGITFLLKYYVWRLLYQNFMGLSWIVCPQHQIEVKKAFPEDAHFELKFFFFHQGRFSLICSCLKTAWAIDTRLVSNGRLFVIFSLKTNLAPMTLAVKTSERFMKKLPWWKKWIIELKVKILILLQTDVMNKRFNSDQWIFYTKNVRYSTLRKKWFPVMKIMHLRVKA